MKITFIAAVLTLVMALPTLAVVIYEANFEAPLYTAGIELDGQNGWTEDTSNPSWNGYVTNDVTAPDGDNQCVYIDCVNGYYHAVEATNRMKFSGWFQMLPGGEADFLEFMYHWSIQFGIKADRVNNECYLTYSYGTQDLRDDDNTALGDWVYASYTIDWTLAKVIEMEFGSKKIDVDLDINTSWISSPTEICLKSWNGTQANSAVKFDNLKVESAFPIPEPGMFIALIAGLGLFLRRW
jgi:hypothetical protein